MPRIVATHAVADIDRWLEGKAERAAAIESGLGQQRRRPRRTGRQQQHRHHGGRERSRRARRAAVVSVAGEEVAAAMEAHGVVQPIVVYVEA